jgi:hypothetical protein
MTNEDERLISRKHLESRESRGMQVTGSFLDLGGMGVRS